MALFKTMMLGVLCSRSRASLSVIGRDVGVSASLEVDEARGRAMLREADALNVDGLYYAGLLHLYGKGGLKASPVRALESFRKGAERGHAASQTALGTLLRHGVGATRDDFASFAWLSRAAESRHLDAMVSLLEARLMSFAVAARCGLRGEGRRLRDWA